MTIVVDLNKYMYKFYKLVGIYYLFIKNLQHNKCNVFKLLQFSCFRVLWNVSI